MSKKELNKYLKEFKDYLEKIKTSEEAKTQYLQDVGVIDSKGKHTKRYKECIKALA